MKQITLIAILLIAFSGFSQTKKEKIQSYLNAKHSELSLTSQDVSDFIIDGETSSESTKINNYFIKQRYQGIEIYNAISNVWIKNDEIINVSDNFIKNVSQKVNTTTPSLSVLQALTSAINKLGIQNFGNYQIIETIDSRNFKISNGTLEDPITAELVFQLTQENTLRLAWDFTIDTPNHNHMWSVRIDAINGAILEKQDMVISCSFENHNHSLHSVDNRVAEFNGTFFKSNISMPLNIQSGSYNVIPYNIESPSHGSRQLITSPHNSTASPYGWHDTNGVAGNEFTITRGNNVHAQEDNDANNGTGISPDGGASLLFNFPYGGETAQPSTYLPAATTNLFYMNNMMHDVWYQYGFNEANGNFQQNNYGKGGNASFLGDAVSADAQDGASANPQNLNNANFSTPVDGTKPRMQMFLWNVSPSLQPLFVNSPANFSGFRDARDNVFSPGHVAIPIAPALIQSDLVLYDDGTPDPGTTDNADACSPAVNAAAINGHIAVIRRSLAEALGGTPCAFTEKVKNAQNAGATAVIIVNNVAPSPTVAAGINMSGADATIVIPAISLTQEVGEALIARMKLETVNATIQVQSAPFVNADGDFDNGIIAHEYGHGISTRLSGGPANSSCLQNFDQMGEGWSDWFALMMLMKTGDVGSTPKGIATFALSQSTTGSGLRSYPYSTDMSINPLTYADSNSPLPTEAADTGYRYVNGDFWATTLWDLTWAYVAKYGFDPNIFTGTGGNNKVMRLVLDGLKLQPCSPTVVSARNALFAADQATTGGQDYCMIAEVFRNRGVGANASAGSNQNCNDQVENFTAFAPGPNCTTLGVNYFENEDFFRVYPNPTNGIINIRINNYVGKANLQIVDINGRIVYQANDNNFNVEKSIDLSNFQSGMYILKVSADDFNFTEKIILK